MKQTLLAVAALSLVAAPVFAQTTTTTTSTAPAAQVGTTTEKVSELQSNEEKMKENTQITNARMAAEAGSKSNWSMKMSLAYSGGSVEKPFDKIRPNYRASSSIQTDTQLGGSIALAKRMNETTAIRLGAGVSMLTPFHNNSKELSDNLRTDKKRILNVSSPFVEISQTRKAGSFIFAPSATLTVASTQYEIEELKNVGDIDLSLTMLYETTATNWQPGVSISGGYAFYTDGANPASIKTDDDGKPYKSGDLIGRADARSDYSVGIFPFLEYAFNDRYSFRTVFGYFQYLHYRSEDAATFQRLVSYQSMGIGIVPMKGVYLYPNIQFIPEDAKPERTNVAISATINVF